MSINQLFPLCGRSKICFSYVSYGKPTTYHLPHWILHLYCLSKFLTTPWPMCICLFYVYLMVGSGSLGMDLLSVLQPGPVPGREIACAEEVMPVAWLHFIRSHSPRNQLGSLGITSRSSKGRISVAKPNHLPLVPKPLSSPTLLYWISSI